MASVFSRLGRLLKSQMLNDLDDKVLKNNTEFDSGAGQFEQAASPEKSGVADPLEADYRANLEVGPDADLNAIRASYRRLLRRYHPDLNASDPEKQKTAEQITQRLNEAWDYLQTKLSDKSGKK